MTAKLGTILLAAGRSSRLGQSKQLVCIDGTSLVRRAAELLLALDPATCVAVTGAQCDAVSAELVDLPVTCEFNASWEQGMGSSIACGVRALPPGLDGAILFLCDQWRINKYDLVSLYEAWCEDRSKIVACGWADVTGPPVIFPQHLFARMASLNGDQGARVVIEKHPGISRRIIIENAAYDLDTAADLQLLPPRHE